MKKELVISAISVLLITAIAAENNVSISRPIHQIGLGLGGVHYQIKDNIVAPLRWDGFGLVGALSYSFVGHEQRHDIDLRVPFAFLSNRYDHEALVLEVNLGYSYLHMIASSESHGQFYFGGLLDWSLSNQYYENWDDSHLYWLNVYELGPVVRWNRIVRSNHKLAVDFKFPLLALISRPPKYRYYDQEKLPKELFSKPHEEMKLTSMHEYIAFSMRCEYAYQVSSNTALEVSYLLNYKTISKPERISTLTNTLLLRFLYLPGKIRE